MKFVIALAALLAVACAAPTPKPARPTPAKGDFRNEFDHLIVAAAVQRFHDLEEFLLKLSEQVADLEKTKNREEKAKILREITIADGLVVGGRTYFEKELKRTDLDLVEKFNFEAVLATIGILDRDLKALATRVNAIKV
uniref:Tyr p 5.03 allergen n=1 Tax=Tyrophagus putrescentiae TaxID=59818 RepID=B2GM95_TYRPU|nr:Tyr p 5.03 allergen [Tyrophagus putrescentiae]